MRFSTGAVRDYFPCGVGPDLPLTIPEAANFRIWYHMAGDTVVTRWENGDVWGSDFRDGTDKDPSGGSDLPEMYFYTGHGICQNPPTGDKPRFHRGVRKLRQAGHHQHRYAIAVGQRSSLKFCFLDASCPMDLVSLGDQLVPDFQGHARRNRHSGTRTPTPWTA